MIDRESALVEAAREAASTLEGYVRFLTEAMPVSDIELHPYVPHVEQVSANIADALSRYAHPLLSEQCPFHPGHRCQVDTSMESGPKNCFHCERPM